MTTEAILILLTVAALIGADFAVSVWLGLADLAGLILLFWLTGALAMNGFRGS